MGRKTSIKTYQDPSISIMFNEEEYPFWLTMIMVCISGVLLVSVTLIWQKCLQLKNQKNKVVDNGDGIEMNGVAGGRAGGSSNTNGGTNIVVVATK